MLQTSQVMVQQLVEKDMLKGSIPKLDNFNDDPQTTKNSFMSGRNRSWPLREIMLCNYGFLLTKFNININCRIDLILRISLKI